jgi:hypothetical protein
MRLQPIVYVTDMAVSTKWYSQLLDAAPTVASEHWSTFAVGGSPLALHLVDQSLSAGNVELSLVADEPLEQIADRLTPHRSIAEEPFGRSLVMADPDGTLIQVNEHDPNLYQS